MVIVAPRLAELRTPELAEAWIGLGSNLGDRRGQLERALDGFGSVLVQVSPLFETSPWGIEDQPWFLNGVARLRWSDGPRSLLDRCLAIEQELGRVRDLKFGPRSVDLDVLILGPGSVRDEGLVVPHPGIASRRSVLEPWASLAPELLVPGLDQSVEQLRAAACSRTEQIVRPA